MGDPLPRRRVPPPHRGRWVVTGALLLVLLAVSAVLSGLIEGGAWWWALMSIGVPLLVAPAVLRTIGVPSILASCLDLVLYVVIVGLSFGILPTREGIERLGELTRVALYAVEHDTVPASSIAELLFAIVAVGGLVAIVLDLLAATAPALVGIPLLVIVGVRSFLDPQGIGLAPLVAVAASYLLLLWADGRVRGRVRSGVGLVVLTSATALALVVTALVPGLEQRGWKGAWAVPIARASSLIDLARDLREASDAEVLRYRSAQTPVPNLQLATLDVYDGTTWVHEGDGETPLVPGRMLPSPIGPFLGGELVGYEAEVEVTGLSADWAPAPYPALEVEGGTGTWLSDRGDYSLRVDGAGLTGQSYRVLSVAISAGPGDVPAGGAPLPRAVLEDLEVPEDVPQVIVDTALAVTAGAQTPLEQANALQAYLRAEGGFAYSTATPDSESDDGMAVVASFLDRKSGYCIHFAAAMTVMARTLGIPARIAIGYLPGRSVDEPDGGEYYSVSNQELHAWPQLYFAGVGWLPFEPTVSRGTPPRYSLAASGDDEADDEAAPLPTPEPSTDPGRETEDVDPGGAASGPIVEDGATTALRIGGWLAALVLLVALLLTPAVWRGLRRRRRLRSLAAGGPSVLGWVELVDTARDLGMPPDPSETPRAFAERLAAAAPTAGDELSAILLDVERRTFGPPEPPGSPETPGDREVIAHQTTAVLRALEASAPSRARIVARWLPRSLLGRLRIPVPRRGD